MIGAGIKFRPARYPQCEWTVLHYARNGAWVAQEPDHGTTCQFYWYEIVS